MKPIAVQNAKAQPDVATAAKLCKDPIIEPKYDGWRIVAIVCADGVRVFSRTWNEYTGMLPEIEAELAQLPVGTILDGEMVAITEADGKFANEWKIAQKALTSKTKGTDAAMRAKVTFVVFDMLQRGDEDISQLTLAARRLEIAHALETHDVSRRRVTLSLQVEAAQQNYDRLVDLGFEGCMVKDNAASYKRGKRGHGWFKLKAVSDVDVILMGYVDGKDGIAGKVGAMVFGQYRDGAIVRRGQCNAPDETWRDKLTAARDGDEPDPYIGRVFTVTHNGVTVSEKDNSENFRHARFARWREDKTADMVEYHNE